MKTMSKLAILMLACAVMLGCSTSKELTQARASYSEALNDPAVARNGASALNDARTALEQAQKADTLEDQISQAYIAQRNVDLARIQADQAQSKMELAQLQDGSDNLSAQLEEQEAAQQLRAYRSRQEAILSNINEPRFAFDKAQLPVEAIPDLQSVAEYLQNNRDYRVLVEGFTDNIGSNQYNEKLGMRRAEAVAQALKADGVSPDRIITRSKGEKFPVASNDSVSGRQQNRRVEITIMNANENPDQMGQKGGGM